MVEGGWEGPSRGQSLRAVLALIKGMDFIPNIIGNLLEGIVHWFVLTITPAMLFAPLRAVTLQPVHSFLRNREVKGRKEDRRGERERKKVTVDIYTDESDGSHHCHGLGTGRAALVGGEIFHPPVVHASPVLGWSPMVLGAGSREVCEESSSSLSLALIAGRSATQVADNNCQMILLCSNKLP